MPDFKRMKSEVENRTSATRRTANKLAITGSYDAGSKEDVTFIKKKKGIEIKWSGRVSIATEETQHCDLGHKHQVMLKKHWTWNYCVLNEADKKELVKFLTE